MTASCPHLNTLKFVISSNQLMYIFIKNALKSHKIHFTPTCFGSYKIHLQGPISISWLKYLQVHGVSPYSRYCGCIVEPVCVRCLLCGPMFVWTFLLRITHTIISQSSADSSWIALYIRKTHSVSKVGTASIFSLWNTVGFYKGWLTGSRM